MQNQIKKIILYIYRPISKILFFIKRILTFHLHLGSSDYYPENSPLKGSLNIFKNNKDRIEFWTKLAKKHKTLKHFYSDDPEYSFLNDFNNKYDQKTLNLISEFYRNGVVVMPNFFSKDEHELINNFFKRKIDIRLIDSNKYSWKSNSSKLNKTIHNKIKIFEKIIFDKNIDKQQYTLSAWKKNKSFLSQNKEDINFHSDRFIPAIKFFYFPSKVEIDPFEYCLGSHKINNQFLNNYKIIHNYPHAEFSSQKLNYNNYIKKKYHADENTLIIAATHGLHRRSQSKEQETSGVRRFITIGYYNKFTRYDLLKNYF